MLLVHLAVPACLLEMSFVWERKKPRAIQRVVGGPARWPLTRQTLSSHHDQ